MISINKKKLIQQLQTKKQRDAQHRFIAEGIKLVGDLIRGGLKPAYIAVLPDTIDKNEYLTKCSNSAEIVECTLEEMKSVSLLKTPSPILAIFEKPDYNGLETEAPDGLTLVLDEIQDPGNMGTIIRIADWFGIRRIICSNTCADAFNPKVVQATMGALARVAIVETDLSSYLNRNSTEWKLPVFGTFLEGENIYNEQLPQRALVVMGNEGNGIGKDVACHITNKLFIPNYPADAPTSESLNVATATAIVCSEFRRRC